VTILESLFPRGLESPPEDENPPTPLKNVYCFEKNVMFFF